MKAIKYVNRILFVAQFFAPLVTGQAMGFDTKQLLPGRQYNSSPRFGSEKLSIYCYKGVSKHIFHFWQSVNLHISLDVDQYETYQGGTPDAVLEEYDNRRNSWSFNFYSWQSRVHKMDPFNSSCIGVHTANDHTAFLHVIRIDFWRVLAFIGGVALFLSSPKLSSNPLFYYICGITFGVTLSSLLLVYMVGRLVPRGPAMYGVIIGGWTVGMYLFRLFWQNIRTILVLYQSYFLAYVTLSALISFCVCYRFGPVSDPRTKRLIQWSMQIGGLGSMYMSSQLQEASMGVVVIFLTYYNFPVSWKSAAFASWHRVFPPKIQLLSEDEYHQQGARETVKALEDLRKYCSSPECNQWRTILKIKKPLQFAEFIEGKSHLSDDELLEYELHSVKPAFEETDDSDD